MTKIRTFNVDEIDTCQPVYNGQYYGFPRVFVIHRFDCTLDYILFVIVQIQEVNLSIGTKKSLIFCAVNVSMCYNCYRYVTT